MDYNPPGSSVHGISQAKLLEWVTISFSLGPSQPRDQTLVSRIACRFFTVWATSEAVSDKPRTQCKEMESVTVPCPKPSASFCKTHLSPICFTLPFLQELGSASTHPWPQARWPSARLILSPTSLEPSDPPPQVLLGSNSHSCSSLLSIPFTNLLCPYLVLLEDQHII